MPWRQTALLIGPQHTSTQALRQALTARSIGQIVHYSEPAAALTVVRNGLAVDLVFVSDSFQPKDILHFVVGAKTCLPARDAAYILILQGQEANNLRRLANDFLRDMDGFIATPCDIDVVDQVMQLAERVRRKNVKTRLAEMVSYALTAFKAELDAICVGRMCGNSRAFSQSTKEIGAAFRSYRDLELELYVDLVIEVFINTPAPPEFLNRSAKAK